MCEHARSAGLHDNTRSPTSSPAYRSQFPATLIQQQQQQQGQHGSNTTDGDDGNSGAPAGSSPSQNQFYRRVYPSIRNLFLRLQGLLGGTGNDPAKLPHASDKVAEVSDMLEQMDINDAEWKDFARFDGKHYTRNLIAHDSDFTVLLLCWNKNQRSPIHSHSDPNAAGGPMSSCWVKVLAGNLRERRFAWPKDGSAPAAAPTGGEVAGEHLSMIGDCTVGAGGVCYINDLQGVHEMGNPCADDVCVSLHVYSPPFYSCYAFNEADCTQRRCVSMLAATAPPREVLGPGSPVTEKPAGANFPAGADGASGASGAAAAAAKDKNSPTKVDDESKASATPVVASLDPSNNANASKALQQQQEQHKDDVVTCGGLKSSAGECGPPANSISLVDFCKRLDTPTTTEEEAVQLFSRLYLGKSEWTSYVHFSDFRYQRLMLHTDHRFSLLMLCWLKGQQTPPHNHKHSRSYVRVLAGELFYHEVDDAGNAVPTTAKKLTKCSTWNTPFVEDDSLAVHVVGVDGGDFAVSLHLYSPPFAELSYTREAPTVPGEEGQEKHGSQHQIIPYAISQQMITKLSVSSSEQDLHNSQHMHGAHQHGGKDGADAGGCSCNLLSNFFIFQEKLGLTLQSAMSMQSLSVAVLELLEESHFSPQELEQYWQLRDRIDYRVRLHDSQVFCVSLNLWNAQHSSVIHDHGPDSLTWCKVLDGSLIDTLYEESDDGSCLEESNTSRLVTGSVTFYGTKAKHSLSNPSATKRAISLHVYCSKSAVLGTAASTSKSAANVQRLLPWGMQQPCRWYTRSAPRQGIRVMSVTAVEDINWRQATPNVASQRRWYQ